MIQREGAGHKLPTPVHQVENSRSEHRALLPLTSLHNSQIISPLGRRLTHTHEIIMQIDSPGSGVTFCVYIYIPYATERKGLSDRRAAFSHFLFSPSLLSRFPRPRPTLTAGVFSTSLIYISLPLLSIR